MTSVPVKGSADSKSEWECVCVCYKGARAVLGNLRISDVVLTMELVKNFLNLPCRCFDPESKRTCLRCLAGQGLPVAPCPVGPHPCCWRVGSPGTRVNPWKPGAIGSSWRNKAPEGHRRFVCPFQRSRSSREGRSLQKDVLPDAGLACRR